MAYTHDGNQWLSRNLAYNAAMDRWETHFDDLSGQLIYFVQAVDGAGNVTVTANKGLFFRPTYNLLLPLVIRGS